MTRAARRQHPHAWVWAAVLILVVVPQAAQARIPTGYPAAHASSAGAAVPRTFPTRASVGLPSGWTPRRTVRGDVHIRRAGAIVEDLRVEGGIIFVDAPDVTLRRIQAVDSRVINDSNNECKNGLKVLQSEFTSSGNDGYERIGPGGYTVRRTVIDGVPEGLRVGGKSVGCGRVKVRNTFIRITPPNDCEDWHGDGIQGYDGPRLVVRRTTILMVETEDCYGTAPFFYPDGQGNTSIDIDGLLVSGGGYSFRVGTPGDVVGLRVVDRQWGYGPIDVACTRIGQWEAAVVRYGRRGSPVPVRRIRCPGASG